MRYKVHFIRRIKDVVEPLYNAILKQCIKFFYYIPVKHNKIVFIQGCGGSYRCSLKYVAEEIFRQKLHYDMVWLVSSFNIEIPPFIRKIKYNRIRAAYELATAHVMINNSKSLYPIRKKPTQTFIYIPHGQPGCKCAEADANLPEEWVRASKEHSSLTNVFVSMGIYHSQVLKDTFWIPENAEIWEIGFPRNDQYYKDTTAKQLAIRHNLNIPEEMCIAFYAPTFRDNGLTYAYNLDFNRALMALERKTGKKWMFFVTLHDNFIWFKKPPYEFNDRVLNMSSYEDIHELLLIADIVISDYSSVALDFSNTRRPVFLYASDIEEYVAMRGLKPMYYNLPFPLAKSNDELERNILDFDKKVYAKKLENFYNIYGSFDDGHSSERFVNMLKAIIK
ncbi:CDP-glycerol glycerophosphotransferase family protein [Prevotella koreensis]|uniref:CDP-glycerol glycerophosphotransferase family protein n=1 Tax=Prevotella koreensis TaxID=2490854 RepID=UPI0028EADCED|nr:CDP-glycerol glycerophosphotransferase family protein [Prevotella koreensis]